MIYCAHTSRRSMYNSFGRVGEQTMLHTSIAATHATRCDSTLTSWSVDSSQLPAYIAQ